MELEQKSDWKGTQHCHFDCNDLGKENRLRLRSENIKPLGILIWEQNTVWDIDLRSRM